MSEQKVTMFGSGVGGGSRGTTDVTSVTGVQLALGLGVQPAKGFWADAWSRVLQRPAAVAALAWLGIVTFLAIFAPVLANGHPIVLWPKDGPARWPLLDNLKSADIGLLAGALLGLPYILLGARERRGARLGQVLFGGLLGAVIIIACTFLQSQIAQRDPGPLFRQVREFTSGGFLPALSVAGVIALIMGGIGIAMPIFRSWGVRVAVPVIACGIAAVASAAAWDKPLGVFEYQRQEQLGNVQAVYTLVPWSPNQRFSELDRQPPMTSLGQGLKMPPGTPGEHRMFYLGTDGLGQDVLTQILHASRLAISIGLVSTGIAVVIGVTLGAIMGYFGGWIDLLLYRVVEVFMAVPVLFLLIVAAAVLPPEMRSTYVMMGIIGCFTWTGAARFTRAEFLKLRNQDFVQSARAVGLPLRSILFKHMLPNGVTPVLVDASFAIAAAISIEATLSYLGLGPPEQASWGKLLASAVNTEGQFKWWLAVYPGMMIFLTVLSYNILGEAMRDAIDPKLRKARV